jgi:hypothetical protein
MVELTLTMAQVDDPPPPCPFCHGEDMQQEFHAPAVIGKAASHRAKANKVAEEIAATDYQVADMNVKGYEGVRNKVRYKDLTPGAAESSWGVAKEALEGAMALGRQQRLTKWPTGPVGSGLDVIQGMLKTGDQPDLIEASKRRSAKIW